MSLPKNNLQELLSRKSSSSIQPTLSPRPNSDIKKPKFRPAISTSFLQTQRPNLSSSSKNATALPAFSTPGFKQQSSSKSRSERPSTVEVIYVSDKSSPGTPNPRKRATPEPDAIFNSSKRARKSEDWVDKENIAPPAPGSVKSKEHPTYMSRISNQPVVNPTTSSIGATCPKPTSTDTHLDLVELSSETLASYRARHNELLNFVMSLLLDGDGEVDSLFLHRLRQDLNQRLNAIKSVQDERKPGKNNLHSSSSSGVLLPFSKSSLQLSIANLNRQGLPTSSTSLFTLATESISTSTTQVANETQHTTTNVAPGPPEKYKIGNDDDYWDSVEEIPEYIVDQIGSSRQYLFQTPYYKELRRQLKNVFGLVDFRPNQLEAITATMAGRDTFILMPTGGGKSLCYQLPAICTTGKTTGVTIVVSPLTALMEDQVSALTKKGVDAVYWNADSQQEEVMTKLWSPDKKPSLLYVTPEKLRASSACKNLLDKLYRTNQLARFAIDEAHCISTWGQDFRSAYQSLGKLREEYPQVPIIALTATANQRTREDIVNQLQLHDHAAFTSSFNRPNLRYSIKNKTKNVSQDIIDFIKKDHPYHSGVIYCMSRKSCQNVAENLQRSGIEAEFFHAGLPKAEKNRLLEEWQADKFRIVVATIAFGMGIDKADVRFVIHHDMPSSLSGYYQETGRAGRDGKPADCILFYRFQDFKNICWMIERDDRSEEPATPESIQRQKDAAREVVKYCANISECRRVQVLHHFGQEFDKRDCRRGCDNCLDDRELVVEDVTSIARSALSIIESNERVTLAQLAGILRGSNSAENRKRGWDQLDNFGAAKSVSKELVELTLDRLVILDLLTLTTQRHRTGYSTEYAEVGQAAANFISRRESLCVDWRPPPKRNQKATKQNYDQVQPSKGKKRASKTLDDDPIEYFPDEDTEQLYSPGIVGSSVNYLQDLYNKLDLHRQQIMIQSGLGSRDAVLSEAVIQSVSYLCPLDYQQFRAILDDAGNVSSLSDVHVQEFVQICIKHKLGSAKKIYKTTTKV